MGMATYYTKIWYSSKEAADKALDTFIIPLFKEGCEAGDWWQRHRNMENGAKFWNQFATRFPLTMNYIRSFDLQITDHNNGLAGKLDFCNTPDDIEDFWADNTGEIRYAAYVWHYADWDPMLFYIQEKTWAEDFAWLSDEYMDPFECLQRN